MRPAQELQRFKRIQKWRFSYVLQDEVKNHGVRVCLQALMQIQFDLQILHNLARRESACH